MIPNIKRKLRKLKKFETQLRFNAAYSYSNMTKYDFNSRQDKNPKKYVWDEFFSTKDENTKSVKYNMNLLDQMNHDELKVIFEEYFYYVYYKYYKENGLLTYELFDTQKLSEFGLSPDASLKAIKQKYRELVKIHHPDQGGNQDEFILIHEKYQKLINKDD